MTIRVLNCSSLKARQKAGSKSLRKAREVGPIRAPIWRAWFATYRGTPINARCLSFDDFEVDG